MFRGLTIVAVIVLGCALTVAQTSQYEWDLPPGVPPPRVSEASPMTRERVELGRHLFYDKRLSGNGMQSCSTCHLQEMAFTDGRAQAVGSTGEVHPRSSMSLINAAYRDALTWSNPSVRTFEEQVLVPLLGSKPVELGLLGNEGRVYATLAQDPVYQKLFAEAFAGIESPVNTPNIAMALSSFLRSIVSFRSPFDRYRFEKDATALSDSARRGMDLFFSNKTRCGGCHMAHNVTVDLGLNLDGGSKTSTSPSKDPPVFMFHNTGLYNLPGPIVYPADNTGLYAHTQKPADVGKFRVPTLRNIALTAPYMHDGSIATLEEVLDHYTAGGRARNPQISDSIKPLPLTEDERRDLLAFLRSLTDEQALRDPRWSDPWKRDKGANPVAAMYLHEVDLVEDNLLRLAEAMPADKYDFRPTDGAFADVRTFGEQVKHAATMIYMTAAIVLEEKSPYGPGTGDNGPDSIQGKAQIVEYFKGSLAYARKAMESLNEDNHLDPLKTYFGPMPRIAIASGIAYHSYDHYGQMVVYARMNGIVPPASQPPAQRR